MSGSTITSNLVRDNTGGILLTDEKGPTAGNVIENNTILNNLLDCGITLAGHNPKATANGKTQPKVAGVYNNKVLSNKVNGNGTKGEGGGILMAVGAPGGAVYKNLIKGNTANLNGLAGVTLHSHSFGPKAPAGDLNGNTILDNNLTHDGVNDASEKEFGPTAFPNTVGILVGSGAGKLKGIVISGNTISKCHFGIYTDNDANKVSPTKNSFHTVAVKVKQV